MKALRKVLPVLGAAALAASLLAGPATVANAAKAAKPTVVGTDPAGDWGSNVDPNLGPVGDGLGQDLTGASITQDGATINFIISLNSLPPNGGAPEVSRYTWDFMVNGKYTEIDGKWSNYSRGACDPTAGSCPPPRDPGMQPFLVRGDCALVEGTNVQTCQELGVVQGVFDSATSTITVPVPADLIGAKKGSKITAGTNIFGGSISAAPAAFLTSGNFPYDTLTVIKTFVVK
jgi:hypothetical protein